MQSRFGPQYVSPPFCLERHLSGLTCNADVICACNKLARWLKQQGRYFSIVVIDTTFSHYSNFPDSQCNYVKKQSTWDVFITNSCLGDMRIIYFLFWNNPRSKKFHWNKKGQARKRSPPWVLRQSLHALPGAPAAAPSSLWLRQPPAWDWTGAVPWWVEMNSDPLCLPAAGHLWAQPLAVRPASDWWSPLWETPCQQWITGRGMRETNRVVKWISNFPGNYLVKRNTENFSHNGSMHNAFFVIFIFVLKKLRSTSIHDKIVSETGWWKLWK